MATTTTLRKKQPSFRNKNLQVLGQRSPAMVDYLQNQTLEADVLPLKSASGLPGLLFSQNQYKIHLHSTYDPAVEAQRWVDHFRQEEWQIGVIFGFGLGYHVEAMLEAFPDRSLIVIEPLSDVLNATLQSRDLRALLRHPNLSIIVSGNAHAAAANLFEQHLRNGVIKGQVSFMPWPPYRRHWSDFWQTLQNAIGNFAKQAYVNLETYQYFAQQWQENFFLNLRTSVSDPSVTSLFSLFKNRPAILVSSGPSLQKNIQHLAEVGDQALIVAAGSAVGPLLAHGIKPHFVVSYDAGSANYFHFTDPQTHNLVLVYSTVIYPRILAEHQGPRFAAGVDVYPYDRWFFNQLGIDRGKIASGPSVANLTWDLLRNMGCDPIIFVGQDLAYGADNRTHAPGMSLSLEQSDEASTSAIDPDSQWVEDIWGNRVHTTSTWLAMKIWFDQRIMAWGKGRTFIDATEGGAKIEGTQIMTLRQALDLHCAQVFYPSQLIAQAFQQQQPTSDMQSKLDRVLKKIVQDLDRVLAICDKSLLPLQSIAETNQRAALTEESYTKYASELRGLDAQLSTNEIYRQFILTANEPQVAAFNAMSIRLKTEGALQRRGELLVELYAALFSFARETTLELKKHIVSTLECPEPYKPMDIVADMSIVADACKRAHPLIAQMQDISQGSVDDAAWSQIVALQNELDVLSAQVNQTETVLKFVKQILEQRTDSVKALQQLSTKLKTQTDRRTTVQCLVDLHKHSFTLLETALSDMRRYLRITN